RRHEILKRFKRSGSSLKARMLSRVFSEDFEKVKEKTIIDPRGRFVRCWSKVFLAACLVSLFVDPIFFLLPVVQPELCLETDVSLEVILVVVRSITDLFFVGNIFVRLRSAYVAPSSRVFGRGELVIDYRKIALRYIGNSFWFDLLAALPFPQACIPPPFFKF
ncbi:putative cyclic nucleotide-gated ion channel 15, partial [Sarracenia purpurea var. burkii]